MGVAEVELLLDVQDLWPLGAEVVLDVLFAVQLGSFAPQRNCAGPVVLGRLEACLVLPLLLPGLLEADALAVQVVRHRLRVALDAFHLEAVPALLSPLQAEAALHCVGRPHPFVRGSEDLVQLLLLVPPAARRAAQVELARVHSLCQGFLLRARLPLLLLLLLGLSLHRVSGRRADGFGLHEALQLGTQEALRRGRLRVVVGLVHVALQRGQAVEDALFHPICVRGGSL